MFLLKKPKVSVLVFVDCMQREALRTLYSLSTAYQQGVRSRDYEVIVVENPSPQMLQPDQIRQFGRNFRRAVHPGDAISPAAAMNFGASLARGQHLVLMTDGAQILSPGVLQRSMAAMRLYDRSVVATLAWHLGPEMQTRSIHEGYCQDVENRLLESVDWRNDGYRLFEISSHGDSSPCGWLGPILESNCITVDRRHYTALGGFCEEFRTGRGGWGNRDFFRRAVADSSRRTVLVLGEGAFQQIHNRAVTHRKHAELIRQCQEEYQRIRGEVFSAPTLQPILFGHMPTTAKRFMEPALIAAGNIQGIRIAPAAPPLPTAVHETIAASDALRDDSPRKVA